MALHICEGEGQPVGIITPTKLSQHYTDTANGHTWISTGLTDQDWVEVGSGVFSGDLNPRQAQLDRLEPSGFTRSFKDNTGVLELSNDGTTVDRIDQNGVYSSSATSTHYDGTSAAIRTFRIMPKSGTPLYVWIGGNRITMQAQSLQLPNTSGTHIIYFDNTGALKSELAFSASLFTDTPIVAIAYWNSTKQKYFLFADERHGIDQSGVTHKWLHNIIGAAYESGMEPLGLTGGSTTFSGIDSGTFYDEDIEFNLQQQTTIPFWHMDGNEWVAEAPDNKCGFKESGNTYVSFNEDIGSGFVTTELASATEAMIIFLVATNNAKYPYAKMIGQKAYLNADNAEGDLLNNYNKLYFGDAPSPEFKVIGAYIVNGNGELAVQACGCPFYDFRTPYASKFGRSFAVASENYAMSNSSRNNYMEYIKLRTQNNDQAKYRIGVSVIWRHSSTGSNINIQITANGVELGVMAVEPKDTGSDIRTPNYGVFYYDLPSSGDLDIAINFKPQSGTSYMYAATVEKWRVV